ncbi:MAG: YHS domain-containing protein [Candidatus Omnitrophica bacterium]|nr:YHS domain-containing protein [Candidatus Omnitrophota bacterium]
MRKIILMSIVVFTFVAFAYSGIAFAEETGVINGTCPVMGGKVDKDTPYTAVHEGKTVGFCCPGCIGKFKADPEKYMAKLRTKSHVIKCPECGAEIDIKEQCKKMGKMDGACPMMKAKESDAASDGGGHQGHEHKH